MLPLLQKPGVRAVLFGASEAASARLLEAVADAEGTDIAASFDGEQIRLRIAAPGRHMAMNAMAALAAAVALGGDLARSAEALAGFAPMAGRGARRMIAVPGGEALLLDESYNASAASVRAALAVLALQPASRRLAVLGDMLELGEAGPAEHAGLAPAIAANADLLFACGPLTREAYEAIPARQRGAHATDSAALAPIVAGAVRPGDAILIKGSLGSRMKKIVQALEPATEKG
jgi:UDP-N-acetylmuramoyl-tripeptide--D-alanyl-D-alanine ligase